MNVASGEDGAVAVRSSLGTLTHDELRLDILGLRDRVELGETIGLVTTDAGVIAAALATLDGWCAEVHLIGPGVDPFQLSESVRVVRTDDLVRLSNRAGERETGDHHTDWVLYTSGTTGEPKPVVHSLATLSRTIVRSAAAREFQWGLLYDPNRMAGLQVLLQAMASGTEVTAPDLTLSLADRIRDFATHGVSALSATPTLWRLILQLPDLGLDLRQITLGGEIADQMVLSALRARFPDARIVHVFASTETGAAFSVRDGREGFPLTYLSDPPRGIRLDIRDDILFVHSPGVSTAQTDGFASTGDVVVIEADRVLFKGRASGVVNVGGANVWPERVESMIRSHPDVAEALVTAKTNALSGHMLIATVVPAPGVRPQGLGKRIRAWVKQQAPNTHVPAMVKVEESIPVSVAGKAVR